MSAHFLAVNFQVYILRISLFFNEASNLNSRFFDYNYLMLVWQVRFFSLLKFYFDIFLPDFFIFLNY
ncbi:hypothetical protein OTBS_1284 [Orientia tsutsugamushi str. Boryong]|uniref:Uncharacterized protein n=1 Tax=Orientia tsutsugamushi (strain Boryong) TaxID=357244 RepID=A5CE87_ORITB|nr:hypothetical protein OTBS_1284 [Orientia tsutsugamushi str. Boryong]